MSLVKEIRTTFDYNNLLLTSTFGSYDGDNQFNASDPHLLEMSKYLDLMHLSKRSTISGLIEMSVPSTKITIQQELHMRVLDSYAYLHRVGFEYLCELFKMDSQLFKKITCTAEKCGMVHTDGFEQIFEKSRQIANNIRFAMRHNLAGTSIFFPSIDAEISCFVEQDTFMDFRTMEGVNLNIPLLNTSYSRVRVVNDAITVSLDEMAQEAQLCKQKVPCGVSV